MEENTAKTDEGYVNPLRDERIIVKHVPKETAMIHNPKHINYGGMAENASRWITVPLLRNGVPVDVLTKQEKDYLEDVLGYEKNALSVHKKKDNFWSNFMVRLNKQDNIFDLSNPLDYIKYKVLLANTDIIASSLDVLHDRPKATYEFVILHENEEAKANKKKVNTNIEAYKELGKIEDDKDKLRVIVETATGKPISAATKLDVLTDKIDKLITADAKLFLRVAKDPMLDTKVLLRLGVECGAVILRNGLYYTSENEPMCEKGDATLSVAAAYLNLPKNQQLKLSIEAKINKENKKK